MKISTQKKSAGPTHLWVRMALAALLLNFINPAARAQSGLVFTGAVDNNWGTSGNYVTIYDPSVPNYTPTSAIPGFEDQVYIGSYNTPTVNMDVNYTTPFDSFGNADPSANTLFEFLVDGNTVITQSTAGDNMNVLYQEAIGTGLKGSGTGEYDQSAGTNTTSNLILSNGTYNLSGDPTKVVLNVQGNDPEPKGAGGETEIIGGDGTNTNGSDTGTFNQTGGTNNVGEIVVGFEGETGVYNLSGSAAVTLHANTEEIGGVTSGDTAGPGTVYQTGGTNIANYFYLGISDGTGTYNLSGASTVVLNATTEVIGGFFGGDSGLGTFNQSGGTNNVGELDMEDGSGGTAIYNLSGGALSATEEKIGEVGGVTGGTTFTQTGGTNTTGDIIVGDQNGSNATYAMSNGAQLQTGTAEVAAQSGSTGILSVDGIGTHFEANTLTVGGTTSAPGGTGSFTLTNGATAHVAVKLGTGTNGLVDVTSGGGLTVGNNVVDPVATAGNINVNTGGTLGGGGIFDVLTLTNGGTVAPGDPATTTINGNYTQTGAGLLVLDIAGPNSADYDHLVVNGELSLESGATLEIDFIDGYVPTPQQLLTFDLIDYETIDPLNATFTNIDIEGLGSGFDYALTPFGEAGTDYQLTVLNTNLAETPEPSTYALVLLGGVLLFLARGRRIFACC